MQGPNRRQSEEDAEGTASSWEVTLPQVPEKDGAQLLRGFSALGSRITRELLKTLLSNPTPTNQVRIPECRTQAPVFVRALR